MYFAPGVLVCFFTMRVLWVAIFGGLPYLDCSDWYDTYAIEQFLIEY